MTMTRPTVLSRAFDGPNWTKLTSVLLSTSVCLIGSMQSARANDSRPSMREFRTQNASLSSRDARQQYRDTYGRGARSAPGASLPLEFEPKGPLIPGVIVNPVELPRGNRIDRTQQPANQTLQVSSISGLVRLNSGVNLDLTSAEKNIVLGANLFGNSGSVNITVGGENKTLTAGAHVTAAEYIAAKQTLSGTQELIVSDSGTADGGTVDLTQITANNDHLRASNLTVASGVTAIGDFGKRSDFTLLGDLTNYGSVVAVASLNSVRGGIMRADDIVNQEGASIASHGISPVASINVPVNFELKARGDLTNLGTVSSGGSVTLTAGSTINNSGLVQARSNVNLNAPTVKNSGRIESQTGNVNFNGPADSALTIDNTAGVIAAVNGAINVRTPDYAGSYDNTVTGGNLLSRELNLYAGTGTNHVNVNQLTGSVSQTGLAGHVVSSTDVLNIGTTCLTGDPTFFNTAGDINITGNISVAEALTIVATGSINSASGTTIEARNASSGFDITMIAGANITSSGTNSPTLPGGTTGAVTIDGTASTAGGSIKLQSAVNTSPTGASGSAGNVSLFAFTGSNASSGIVDIDQATVNAGGAGTGVNGNLTIVAGGDNNVGDAAIQIGPVNLAGGTGGGGNLSAITAQPQSSGGAITYNANGTRTSAAQLVAGNSLTANADIAIKGTGTVVNVGGDVTLRAGRDLGETENAVLYTDNFDAHIVLEANRNIGFGFGSPFTIDGFSTLFSKKVLKTLQPGNTTLSAIAHTGDVNIERTATTNLTVLASSAEVNFLLLSSGALNINGNVAANTGFISLENTGGNLTIAPSAKITALGFIDIYNTTSKKLKPIFTVGQNAEIKTTTTVQGFSDITLAMDPSQAASNSFKLATASEKRNPPHYAGSGLNPFSWVSPFAIFATLGPNGINTYGKPMNALAPNNNFNANKASIDLYNYRKGGMSFNGGVNVTAGQ